MKIKRLICSLLAMTMVVAMMTGCEANVTKEDADTITVYLWSTNLYESYAPYNDSELFAELQRENPAVASQAKMLCNISEAHLFTNERYRN